MTPPLTILICGGAGFIGSHLAESFLQGGHRVTVVDPCKDQRSPGAGYLSHAASSITWIKEPVESLAPSQWNDLLAPADWVIDTMGLTRHWEGLDNPHRDAELNYLNHLCLVSQLRQHPTPTVYLGSRGQYGPLTGAVQEDAAQRPQDPQGAHKAAAESLLRIYAERTPFPAWSLRLGNCFGPRQPLHGRDIGLVGGFIRQLIRGQTVEVYGDPATRARQFVYVRDVAVCVRRLLELPAKGFQPLNLAGPNVLLSELLSILTGLVGGDYRFAPFPQEMRNIDCGNGYLDETRLRKLLPDLPVTSLNDSLEETCDYFRKEPL